MRELKNKIVTQSPAGLRKNDQILDNSEPAAAVEKPFLKSRDDGDREKVRKRERKALLKSL